MMVRQFAVGVLWSYCMSPGNNQVSLSSPPYGRHVYLVVGGDHEGIIKSVTDLDQRNTVSKINLSFPSSQLEDISAAVQCHSWS
jgi:hypothetical protein